MTDDVQAQEYIARWRGMESERMTWMVEWDHCARYIMPRKGQILTKLTPGQSQSINLYDTTATEAADIFGAGMLTHITPAGEKWFRLEPKNKDADQDLKDWLDRVSDIAIEQIYASNAYLALHEDMLDAGVFGSSLILLEEGKKKPLNFINIPVGTFAWAEDAEGNVDTVARQWTWTARQAAQKWGKDKLGKTQRESFESNEAASRNRKFTYLHFVEPREDANYKGGLVAPEKRPIRSIYICIEDNQVIEEGGYYTMPLLGSRLLRSNNELYGRGPGMTVLPEVRTLNAMERDILTAVEKMVNPPWLVGDEQTAQLDGRPNGITYWDTSNPAGKPEQVILKNNIDLGEQKTEQKRNRVRAGFYNPLFQMLTNMEEQKREKTAYEVQQMVAEKLLLFSPIFARYTTEKISPMLERVVDILARNNMLPPPPETAQGEGYEIVYTSKVALALKAAENQSFATMMTLIEQAAALDPSVVHVVKVRDAIRRVGHNIGVPSVLMRSESEINRIIDQQNQAQAAAMAAQTGEVATRAVKNLGPTAQTEVARKIIGGAGRPA